MKSARRRTRIAAGSTRDSRALRCQRFSISTRNRSAHPCALAKFARPVQQKKSPAGEGGAKYSLRGGEEEQSSLKPGADLRYGNLSAGGARSAPLLFPLTPCLPASRRIGRSIARVEKTSLS